MSEKQIKTIVSFGAYEMGYVESALRERYTEEDEENIAVLMRWAVREVVTAMIWGLEWEPCQ